MSASQGADGLSAPIRGLAVILALGAAVFFAPQLWPLIDGQLWHWLHALYGSQAAYWLHWAGHVLTYPLTFFAARIAITSTFLAIAAFIAKRLA